VSVPDLPIANGRHCGRASALRFKTDPAFANQSCGDDNVATDLLVAHSQASGATNLDRRGAEIRPQMQISSLSVSGGCPIKTNLTTQK